MKRNNLSGNSKIIKNELNIKQKYLNGINILLFLFLNLVFDLNAQLYIPNNSPILGDFVGINEPVPSTLLHISTNQSANAPLGGLFSQSQIRLQSKCAVDLQGFPNTQISFDFATSCLRDNLNLIINPKNGGPKSLWEFKEDITITNVPDFQVENIFRVSNYFWTNTYNLAIDDNSFNYTPNNTQTLSVNSSQFDYFRNGVSTFSVGNILYANTSNFSLSSNKFDFKSISNQNSIFSVDNSDLMFSPNGGQQIMSVNSNEFNYGINMGQSNVNLFRIDNVKNQVEVDGKLLAREVLVTLSNPWPDYVFDDNNKLKSIEEVKSYIEVNKHLPNIPDAKEIEEKGIGLGELARRQMEKIEELTLYIIELDSRMKRIEEENILLNEKNKNK